MRIIATGGRYYADMRAVIAALDDVDTSGQPVTLVHGAAAGADRLAAAYARVLGWTIEPHPPQWARHGRAAGPIRNQAMADMGADLCIAFPGGEGTARMIEFAEAAGIPVRRITAHTTTEEPA